MGRKPLPDAVKRTRGTLQKCRSRPTMDGEKITNISEVMSSPNISYLNNPRALEILREKVQYLITLGIMEAAYIDLLAAYAYNLERYEYCTRQIEQTGKIIIERVDRNGNPVFVENPLVKLSFKYLDQVKALASEYGLTPIARQKLPPSEEGNLSVADTLIKAMTNK